MGVYIKGMEMPTTGLYFVSVDNSNGFDKTVVTVERMLGNRDVRQIIGSYEAVPVPPHGRLIDADAFVGNVRDKFHYDSSRGREYITAEDFHSALIGTPTVIEAEEGE